MDIESPCKIEFIPEGGEAIALVNVGDFLAALPKINAEQDLFEADGMLLANAVFKPLGGTRVSVSFSLKSAPGTHAAAQGDFLNAELAGTVNLLQVEGALVFTSYNQITTYDPAVIVSMRPGLPFGSESVTTREIQIRTVLPIIEFL